MLWWMGSRWTWAFGIQQDKKTMIDSAHFPIHRRYYNRQCCIILHLLWLSLMCDVCHVVFLILWCRYTVKYSIIGSETKKATPLSDMNTSFALFLKGSGKYGLWLHCVFHTRMYSSSVFRLWVPPHLKTSVPRWVDALPAWWKLKPMWCLHRPVSGRCFKLFPHCSDLCVVVPWGETSLSQYSNHSCWYQTGSERWQGDHWEAEGEETCSNYLSPRPGHGQRDRYQNSVNLRFFLDRIMHFLL